MKTLEVTASQKTLIQIRRAALKGKVALSKLLEDCSKFNQNNPAELALNPARKRMGDAVDSLMDLMNQCSARERTIDRLEQEDA